MGYHHSKQHLGAMASIGRRTRSLINRLPNFLGTGFKFYMSFCIKSRPGNTFPRHPEEMAASIPRRTHKAHTVLAGALLHEPSEDLDPSCERALLRGSALQNPVNHPKNTARLFLSHVFVKDESLDAVRWRASHPVILFLLLKINGQPSITQANPRPITYVPFLLVVSWVISSRHPTATIHHNTNNQMRPVLLLPPRVLA